MQLPPIIDRQLFKQALTHRSYVNEYTKNGENNERLEFLGDAVLGFLVGELLYRRYQEISEAQLTRLRAMLVDQKQLAEIAQKLDLGKLILIGKGAEKDNVRESPAVLSDTFEAVIGAYFLDAGIAAVQNYVESIFMSLAEEIISSKSGETSNQLVDTKNLLQQWAIVNLGENPSYELIAEFGPPHAKTFTTQVHIQGKVYGVGQGRKKQEAEKQAALAALQRLGIEA
ncbi:ribonuclease III [Gloeocapsa sp. PCC 73106]|uniref:ribonuclease III n=1 Tax=Gloeocapsa sp. PCC 73106 TaxID=102232 RepID=UPI0002ABD7B5|nr:ribonuclease III [Gloeocapsa sp. PCC 73106]ELR97877.1 ribonuclease III [Gloeocapsa sp. PCC 73106]